MIYFPRDYSFCLLFFPFMKFINFQSERCTEYPCHKLDNKWFYVSNTEWTFRKRAHLKYTFPPPKYTSLPSPISAKARASQRAIYIINRTTMLSPCTPTYLPIVVNRIGEDLMGFSWLFIFIWSHLNIHFFLALSAQFSSQFLFSSPELCF